MSSIRPFRTPNEVVEFVADLFGRPRPLGFGDTSAGSMCSRITLVCAWDDVSGKESMIFPEIDSI